MKTRKVTVLIVPDLEGTPHTFKLSLLAIRVGIALVVLGFILFLVMAFSWGGLLRRAGLVDRLAQENEQFRFEQQRVFVLEARVRQLQQFEDQIRRALGSNFVLNSSGESYSVLIPGLGDTIASWHGGTPSERASRPVAIRSTFRATGDAVVYQGIGIPSLWPVEGFISRGFEWNPVAPGRSHSGVDIAGREGAVIKATADGIVVWCGWSARYGNLVVLAHPTGYFSVYGHNQTVLVEPRQRVKRGTPIALLGNTGQSSAPHLHFEIWLGNQPLDPLDLLATS